MENIKINIKSGENQTREQIKRLVISCGLNFVDDKPIYDSTVFEKEMNFEVTQMQNYFKERGFEIKSPLPLVQNNSTTLFVTAGVQVLDPAIQSESELPQKPIFINQPVLRSQFLGSTAIESHTAFHNLVTLDLNISLDEHVSHLKAWIDFLEGVGYDRSKFTFDLIDSNPKWGKRSFSNHVIGVYYGGLDVGDAVYIPAMPQDSRPTFSISDIGFGLERLLHKSGSINPLERDCLKTLALLTMSGVTPINKGHGYRFRLFSKHLVSACGLDYSRMISILNESEGYLNYWKNTLNSNPDNFNAYNIVIRKECERNFNREVLDFLEKKYAYTNEIDINQSTVSFLNQLRLIGNKPKSFWDNIEIRLKFNRKL